MAYSEYRLIDDGSLDTVLMCLVCDEEMQFNPEWGDEEECGNCEQIERSLKDAAAAYECQLPAVTNGP